MKTVSAKLVDLLERPISDADRKRAALLLLDWTGCTSAGAAEPFGDKLSNAISDGGNCLRIGASPASISLAAFHNGCLGNVLEMDDVDKRAVLHAAPTVIPAALAMAQHTKADAKALLDAIVIGYEATIRMGRAVGSKHYHFFHNTATCGPFGAAAAACHLLEGSDMVGAFGLAGTQAAGLWQTRHEPKSAAKQIHAGHAAHVGVQAALLSAQSILGPASILEGIQGFFAALCPGGNPIDVLRDYVQENQESEWLIHQTSIKPYAACRHAHAPIDAALLAKDEGGEITIETYKDALKFCDKPDPSPGIEAKFSLQHVVGHVLLTGTAPKLTDFDQRALSITADIRKRISVKSTDEFNQAYPAHYGAAVIVGGKQHVTKDALGDPEKPLSEDQIKDKARMLLKAGGKSDSDANQIIESCLNLAGNGSLDEFIQCL